MSSSIPAILKRTEVIKEGGAKLYTHVSLTGGKYQMDRDTIEDFWEMYPEFLEEGGSLSLGEMPDNTLPVLVDVDLSVREPDDLGADPHLYTRDQAQQVIDICQSVLRKIIDGCTDKMLTCILLEKPLYYAQKSDATYAKNGFHLHFPWIFMSRQNQRAHFIPRIKDELKEWDTFADIVEDSSTVIDDCCSKAWLIYGAKKDPNANAYTVSAVYDSACDEISLEEAFQGYSLFDMYGDTIPIKGNVRTLLPRILSIKQCHRPTVDVKASVMPHMLEVARKVRKGEREFTTVAVEQQLKRATKLLEMISDRRAEDRNEWMTIGWVLFNIGGHDCMEALDLWMEFSQRCPEKFDEAVCIDEWDNMTERNITIGTLYYYARVDNPDAYKKMQEEDGLAHLTKSLRGSHNSIAKLMYALFRDKYKCASITGASWFEFKGHTWREIDQGTFLREKISSEIADMYSTEAKKAIDELRNLTGTGSETEEKLQHEKIKVMQKMLTNLDSAPYKNNVMREAMEVFYDPDFKDRLDLNPWLVSFRNGTYELDTHRFRPGRPEDYRSKSAPIDYIEYSEEDDAVQTVYRFLEQVFPDRDVRTFWMDVYSEIFVGNNSMKAFFFWTGKGNNAKSVTQNIMEEMLGELAVKFNTTLFTGKKAESGAPNPELARAGPGTLHASMDEPNNDEQLSVGYLKALSGGDKIFVRDLFEKGKSTREIKPSFTITVLCNNLPDINQPDPATWERIYVFPFESTFLPADQCPPTYEEQLKEKKFPRDYHFQARIPTMLSPLAWVLLNHRKKPKMKIAPQKVREATERYQRQNNIYLQFVQEVLIEDANARISVEELFGLYADWFRKGFPGYSLVKRNVVREYFDSMWEPSVRNKWRGWRQRTIHDDLENGDAIVVEENVCNYKSPLLED